MRGRVMVLCSLVLFALPGATAAANGALDRADLQLTIHGDPVQLEPGGPPRTIEWTLSYRTVAPSVDQVTVHLEPAVNEGFWQVEIEPSTVTLRPTPDGAPGASSGDAIEGRLTVAATPIAKAFVSDRLIVEAWTDGSQSAPPAETTGVAVATPGYQPGLSVEPASTETAVPEGEEAHVRATIQSYANGPTKVTYWQADTPEGCSVDPIHEDHIVPRWSERETVFHLACAPGAEGGQLSITYGNAYAIDDSLEGEPVTVTWNVQIERSPAVEAQAALLGTSASLAGVPISMLALLGLLAGALWTGHRPT